MKPISTFHTQRPGNYSIFLSDQKAFSYHICMKTLQNIQESEIKRQAKLLRLFSAATKQYASEKERIN